jgi:hypothetical protein
MLMIACAIPGGACGTAAFRRSLCAVCFHYRTQARQRRFAGPQPWLGGPERKVIGDERGDPAAFENGWTARSPTRAAARVGRDSGSDGKRDEDRARPAPAAAYSLWAAMTALTQEVKPGRSLRN